MNLLARKHFIMQRREIMQVTANNAMLRLYSTDNRLTPELTLTLTDDRQSVMRQFDVIHDIVESGKLLSVEIKQYRQRRSLDSNAYLWVLLAKLATVLNTDKDSLYIEMLDRYGVFTHIVVKPEMVDRVKNEWRTVRELGEVIINGKAGVQLQCYFGSSTYNSAEMAKLIDGVVSECKDVGVEVMPPDELELMKSLWGG
jgi:hypothetical protein